MKKIKKMKFYGSLFIAIKIIVMINFMGNIHNVGLIFAFEILLRVEIGIIINMQKVN